MGSGEPG